jgi:hypothetical protein
MTTRQRTFWIGTGIAVAIGLALALRLAVFTVGIKAVPAFDDECKIALQAKQIARGDYSLLILASPYIFPLDAYLMAPWIRILPRTAFGARILAFGFGLLSLGFSWLILQRWGRLRDFWPGAALLLVGSGYLHALQIGCAMPGYGTLLLLSSVAVWLAQRQADRQDRLWLPALLVGIAGGLACSETMLSLPVLLTAGAMMALHRNGRAALQTCPAVAIGALLGLLPYLAATHLHADAFASVQQSIPWHQALRKLFSPVLDRTLPAALGIAPPVFPDTRERVGWLAPHGLWFSVTWLVMLTAATLVALGNSIRRWRRERWPSIDVGLVFTGISWLCLGLFLFSGRSHSHTYRYFAPLVWSFPFVVAYLYRHTGTAIRGVIGTVTVVFMAIQLANSAALLSRWSAPGFADELKSYDLRPAIRYLEDRGIRHGYATYVDAYRFTFETDERLVVCQPYNERFPGWLVPFKDQVDAATNVAYILSDTYRFPPERLADDLKAMNVAYRTRDCGHYVVFTDFTCPSRGSGTALPHALMRAEASHNPSQAADMLDGTPDRFWRCEGALQQTGMWVAVTWESPRTVQRLLMDHGLIGRDHARRINVLARVDSRWVPVASGVPGSPAPFEFRNGRPVYGRAVTDIVLPQSIRATGLKVEIAEPRLDRAWTIRELDVMAGD